MSEQYPLSCYQSPHNPVRSTTDGTCKAVLQLVALSAVVGASPAAGANIRRVQRDQVTAGEALVDTGRAAVTAAAAVSAEGLTRLGVLFAAGTAVSYAVQRRWAED